jgi:preprotein translocase subunit YajC
MHIFSLLYIIWIFLVFSSFQSNKKKEEKKQPSGTELEKNRKVKNARF